MATLAEKFNKVIDYVLKAVLASDKQYKELTGVIAERDEAIAALTAQNEALKAEISELGGQLDTVLEGLPSLPEDPTPTPEENPTPGIDELVKEADELNEPNSPEVQDALDNTVGTSDETPESAGQAALQMLFGDIE